MSSKKKPQGLHKTKKKSRLTGNPIRTLPFLEWRNNSAPLETMRGHTWTHALRRERTFWNALVKRAHITKLQKEMEMELKNTASLTNFNYLVLGNGAIQIMVNNSSNFNWKWAWSNRTHYVSDLDFWDNKAYYITEDEKDRYISNLMCQDETGHIVWSKHGINGPVAVKDGLCYYITVIYPFNTIEVVCCDAKTGKNTEVILKEPSEERFLTIIKESNKTLYCKSTSWTEEKMWRIESKRAIRVQENSRAQFPVGYIKGSENGLMVKKDTMEWSAYGPILSSWILPKEEPLWLNIDSGHLITIHNGRSTLYLCAPHKKPRQIHQITAGEFNPNPFAKWHGASFQSFIVFSPEDIPYVLFVTNNSNISRKWRPIRLGLKPEFMRQLDELKTSHHTAVSADGTNVPYIMVKSAHLKRIRGILCYIYAAYGSTTNVSWPYIGWGPLLKRGIAIVYCYARGSGDNNYAWAKAGQEERHIRTVEDFEATIRDVQKLTGLGPNRTIIYGRSAGGMMVGATTLRNPTGNLMGCMYTEVPFTDLLRTQTNMSIDLTPSGVSEYGSPSDNPSSFRALMRLSVMESIPDTGAPGVFVLSRTGLRDLQVLPFEPVKFIQKLRGTDETKSNNKFLDYEKDETHVYSFQSFVRARATDLALLFRWIENKI
jgi:Prolyl oligopeptidase family